MIWKLTKILLLLILVIAIQQIFIKPHSDLKKDVNQDQLQQNKRWETFSKKDKKIYQSITSQAELEQIYLDNSPESPIQEQLRKPTSLEYTSIIRDGKELIGEDVELYQDPRIKISFINNFNPGWKKLLSHKLLLFMPDETLAFIKNEKSYIEIKKGKGKYIEKVIISLILPDGRRSSFHASVDAETGKIINTWNKTKIDGIGFEEKTIVPSGTI